ncbi:MAG: hypothetical protein MJ239_02205 [Bacilli bacterium]|nr:hypothetical protein [Bacilli bacterium]
MITDSNTVIRIISNDLSGLVEFEIESAKTIKSLTLDIFDGGSNVFSCSKDVEASKTEISAKINEPKLWSVNHPNLYTYKLVLKGEQEEVVEDTFAIRKISTNGKYICINDTPIFVKGYIRGATAHEHSNNLNISEEEFYRKNIKQAKAFGFNLVRFHSQIPSDTFFKVADEEGLLVHIEMRPPHDLYNNLEEMIHTRNDFISEEFISDTINRLFNHPSLLVYCLGNEIRNLSDNSIVTEIGKEIKRKDPTRLYLDTCAWGENGRPIVDIDVQHLSYFFPFGKHAGMYDDTKNLMLGDFNKGKEIKFDVPLLAHEVCHYTALRDFKSLKEKFVANEKNVPWWIDSELNLIKEKGYEDRYEEMYHASKLWQLMCWKIAYEAMRNSTLLGGFHFLQFADTDVYENSNGVVDCFDDVNYLTPEQFKTFNGDIIITALVNKYNYYAGDTISLPVTISRFDELNLSSCDLRYRLKVGDTVIEKIVKDIDVSKHDHYQIYEIKEVLPPTDIQKEATLELTLLSKGNKICSNRYSLYVYPRREEISYEEFVNYEKGDVVVTDDIEKCLSALGEGKNVCLVYRSDYTRHVLHKDMKAPKYAFKASWNRFKPVIWDRGTNFGGIIDISKLTKYGFNNPVLGCAYCSLSEDSDKIILDNQPWKSTNLISGIDKCNRDRFDAYKGSFNLPEPMPDRTLRDYSYLFSLKVGEGKLLVTGFNLLGLDENESSANNMAHFIIDYLNSKDFNPEGETTIEEFRNYLKESAEKPVKERMMTQFWALDDAPVESKQYWEDSRAYLKD